MEMESELRNAAVPPELKLLLEALSWAMLKNQPQDISHFASEYSSELLQFRAENPGLDLDTLIQEFRRTKGVKFYTKSNTSCSQSCEVGPLTSDSITVTPSIQQSATMRKHRLSEVQSATGFTMSSGCISPESAQNMAVFRRKTDQETVGPLASNSVECLQVYSALFERVSVHEIASEMDTILIQTSSLPCESTIMVQTEEIPEMIVFQAAPTIAKGPEEENVSPNSAVKSMSDVPESPHVLLETLQVIKHTVETPVAGIQQDVGSKSVSTEVSIDQSERPTILLPTEYESLSPSLPPKEPPQPFVSPEEDTGPTRDTLLEAMGLETVFSTEPVTTADGPLKSPPHPELQKVMVSPTSEPLEDVRAPTLQKPPCGVLQTTVKTADEPAGTHTAPPAGELKNTCSVAEQTDVRTPVLGYLPLPESPSLVHQRSMALEEVRNLQAVFLPLIQEDAASLESGASTQAPNTQSPSTVFQQDSQVYTAHSLSQYPAGVSTGQPAYTRPTYTLQQPVYIPNYAHGPGPLGPADTTAPIYTHTFANLAGSGSYWRQCHLTNADPQVQQAASCLYHQAPGEHLSNIPVYQDCSHQHHQPPGCLSHRSLHVQCAAKPLCTGQGLSFILSAQSSNSMCCHSCRSCLRVQCPLLLHHNSQPTCSHQNQRNQVDAPACPHGCQQAEPGAEREKRNIQNSGCNCYCTSTGNLCCAGLSLLN